jgi:hypothetical protein
MYFRMAGAIVLVALGLNRESMRKVKPHSTASDWLTRTEISVSPGSTATSSR